MARKRLVPSPGYGQSLYDAIKHQRRSDGTQWEAEDLAARLADGGVSISAKQIREWMKHGRPNIAAAMAIAQLFGVTVDEMWKGTAKPINLPQVGRPTLPRGGDGPGSESPADDRAHREALGKRLLPLAERSHQAKSGRKRKGRR